MKYELWPHQTRAISLARKQFARGRKRMCVVAPPGAGKSLVMREMIDALVSNGKRVNIYLHRRMLTRQTIGYYESHGLPFSVVARGFEQWHNPGAPIQICSIQTVNSRKDKWNFDFPECDFFFVDEKHQQIGRGCESVFKRHLESGAVEIGFTATPTGLSPSTCDALVPCANYTELIGAGAHVPCDHYSPDMPAFTRLEQEISEQQSLRFNPPKVIFGRVIEHWHRLNPDQRPAVLFAPSVKASRWYAEEFIRNGIPVAHIDAERTIFSRFDKDLDRLVAVEYETSEETRAEIMRGSETGKYKVICNRFILREAIDMPWLFHGIAATTFGSISSFLQASGRILRNHPSLDRVIWQDHGGNIYRHGYINEDREWYIGKNSGDFLKERREAGSKAEVGEVEPIVCPRCGRCRTHGSECPYCHHIHKRSSIMVRELDGELKKVSKRFFKKVRQKTAFDMVNKSIYTHRGLCMKSKYRKKTVEDVFRYARNLCKTEGIECTNSQLWGIIDSKAQAGEFDRRSDFQSTFFPGGW